MIFLLALALADAPPEASFDTVVTATRSPRPLRDAPAETYVIPRSEIEHSPTLTTDELVRTVPDAQTFRRSSSLAADPTSQGLSLRGVAPSGVSRALVLLDGIPVNDGYGGWVYWRALPRLSIDHIEVVPGGGSAQYGSAALGGVLQLVSRPLTRAFDADAEVGTQGTMLGAARAAQRWGAIAAALEIEGLHSDGFIVTSPHARGAVDMPAPTTHGNANARMQADLNELSVFASGGYFAESQNSGTPLSGSAVRLGHAELGLDAHGHGEWHARLYGRIEEFDQTRSRVAPDRSSETLSATQVVPSDDLGLTFAWNSWPLSGLGTHVLSAGVDAREIAASSREALASGAMRRISGSQQQIGGVFAQESWQPATSLEVLGALRLDLWRNAGGERLTTDTTGTVTSQLLASTAAAHLSPKLAARFNATSWLTLRGGVYDSFRAPTLNELYRPFQVGTVLTAANDRLAPETLLGGELGAHVALPMHAALRVTGFINQLSSPIINETLSAPLADGSARQRENIGSARIAGLEAGIDWRFIKYWLLSAAYTFVDTRVTAAPAALMNKRLAQDPAHRFTASLSFTHPRYFDAMVQVRFSSGQYEDDLNTLPIAPYAVVDLSVSRRIIGPAEFFVAVENLFNTTYVVGRAGIDTVGAPLSVRAGLRVREL